MRQETRGKGCEEMATDACLQRCEETADRRVLNKQRNASKMRAVESEECSRLSKRCMTGRLRAHTHTRVCNGEKITVARRAD
ncbi:hypothetical protein NDU88_003508 [Pleurodeles waltl]|uniref:Uncharacterized protein n=1 Tax=Pleurodeles waltl TaxID=8319 RepID=A0AAV7T5A3_PLEWA|nr:hypothetical protein NDU88_003508 [Pleurodeles waltl]